MADSLRGGGGGGWEKVAGSLRNERKKCSNYLIIIRTDSHDPTLEVEGASTVDLCAYRGH